MSKTVPKKKTLRRVIPDFDLNTFICRDEQCCRSWVVGNDGLQKRMESELEEMHHYREQMHIQLITDCYRVDREITPKLYRLGFILKKIFKISKPVDIFVKPSSERNAFCLPSKKDDRYVICLNSSLLDALTSDELMFVMGHELGHAILKHGAIPRVSFDDSEYSPMEVFQLRALDRAQEISCDRFGLLACQDVRVASTALFKIASGLSERWISFNESAYARHFDALVSMSESVEIESISRTHPLIPLRVKALITFFKSSGYADAFGLPNSSITLNEVEDKVKIMLSSLLPDLTVLEKAEEKEVAFKLLMDGAMLVIAADGKVDPSEIAWLESFTDQSWSVEELGHMIRGDGFQEMLQARISEHAYVLRHKLSEQDRSGLFHVMCGLALDAGVMPEAEMKVLDQLRRVLGVRVELAREAFDSAIQEDGEDEKRDPDIDSGVMAVEIEESQLMNSLLEILKSAKLTEKSFEAASKALVVIESQYDEVTAAVRALVSWTIQAAKRRGAVTKAQGKRIVLSSANWLREYKNVAKKNKDRDFENLLKRYGMVILFRRGETVVRTDDSMPLRVVSISRTKALLYGVEEGGGSERFELEPSELWKDPVYGSWGEPFKG